MNNPFPDKYVTLYAFVTAETEDSITLCRMIWSDGTPSECVVIPRYMVSEIREAIPTEPEE